MSLSEQDRRAERRQEILVLSLAPVIVGGLIVASWALSHWQICPTYVDASLAVAATLLGGWQRFISGIRDIFHRSITVNVFVIVAIVATVATGEFRPAAIIVFIMSVVGGFESYTLNKSRRSIRDLLDLTPPTATVKRGDGEVSIRVDELRVGDVAVVRPGERIPVDGAVLAGASSVNQAPITGESMPVDKHPGDEVFSGTLNEAGLLEIRTGKTGADTTLSRIVHLVEEAQETRAPIQGIADRFTVWFLPLVLFLAVVAFLTSGDVKVAVAVLLVACPCAFAIATPTAVTAGISNLARRGVLIKGGAYLELGGKVDALVVDKTGTLTFGRTMVTDIVAVDGVTEEEVLRLAAIAEKYSEHPLGKAVVRLARERRVDVPEPDEFKADVGMGVVARHGATSILVGKIDLLRSHGMEVSTQLNEEVAAQAERGRTAVLVARGQEAIGILAIADEVRPETSEAVTAFQSLGVSSITMLTGDNPSVAQAVAQQIGLEDFRAGLLPEDKQRAVKKLQRHGKIVAMVGDGINDAPSLALADVGIVMGAAGTDVAIEAADVTLMNDDLSRTAEFMLMSRIVLRRIKLNIFFSIIYNAVGLVLGTLGLLTPVLAVVFQEAGCITVVLSSTLLLWVRPKLPTRAGKGRGMGRPPGQPEATVRTA